MGAHPLALLGGGHDGAPAIVAVRGEIDVAVAPALREWLWSASDAGRRPVVVDLSGVQFLAVSGLYVLCDEQARLAANQVRLTVACDRPEILKLLSICRLADVLAVVPSRASVPMEPWGPADEERAERMTAWLERYERGMKETEAR